MSNTHFCNKLSLNSVFFFYFIYFLCYFFLLNVTFLFVSYKDQFEPNNLLQQLEQILAVEPFSAPDNLILVIGSIINSQFSDRPIHLPDLVGILIFFPEFAIKNIY